MAASSKHAEYGDDKLNGQATTGLVLGIISLFFWIVPIIGLPVSIVGLVFSIRGLKSTLKGSATAGVVMSSLGLLGSLGNGVLGAILAYSLLAGA